MSQNDKKKIAEAKFITGETIAAIADQLDISRRTVERWANEGNWRDLKLSNQKTSSASNVVPIGSAKPKKNINTPTVRDRTTPGLNDLEIIEDAISELYAALPEADDKSKGSIAGAIVRLIEQKRKLCVVTVADLVEQAIDIGIGPEEFLLELKSAWQRRA